MAVECKHRIEDFERLPGNLLWEPLLDRSQHHRPATVSVLIKGRKEGGSYHECICGNDER